MSIVDFVHHSCNYCNKYNKKTMIKVKCSTNILKLWHQNPISGQIGQLDSAMPVENIWMAYCLTDYISIIQHVRLFKQVRLISINTV